tara:strand:+ start:188 stop:502 length:315 start_codon:yes stop_codon:yes gene_type:complete
MNKTCKHKGGGSMSFREQTIKNVDSFGGLVVWTVPKIGVNRNVAYEGARAEIFLTPEGLNFYLNERKMIVKVGDDEQSKLYKPVSDVLWTEEMQKVEKEVFANE